MRALVTGATGFIGGRLALLLADRGAEVRALVRDPDRARYLEQVGCVLHRGDVLQPDSLRGAGRGTDVAYYLVHGMGRGSAGDFEERDRSAARNFARMAREEGVGRVVYLGGRRSPALPPPPKPARDRAHPRGGGSTSHLLPRRDGGRRAERVLCDAPPSRAALPVMVAPAWLKTPTQPIAIDDVLEYLAAAPGVRESAGREVQIGGPDVLSYGQMLDRMAHALGRRAPWKLPVPILTPWLSSFWIGLVTPVDAGVARPLVESLSTETVISDPSGAALFPIVPIGFDEALRRALSG